MSKSKTRLGNNFHFKNQIPKDFTSGVVYKFHCGLCNEYYYIECVGNWNVRIGEHSGISPLTKKQVKPKNSSVAVFYYFATIQHPKTRTLLTRENKKSLPESKENLLIMRYKPSLNRIITSTSLCLFKRA